MRIGLPAVEDGPSRGRGEVRNIVSAELEPDLAARLKRLSQVTGAPKTSLLRAALADFIEKCLRENNGWRETFERYTREDEARAAAPTRGHLKVIK
jgi:predicted transcriptional regulator